MNKQQGTVDFISKQDNITFGTWVWSSEELSRPKEVLDFLTSNCVNEIYLTYAPTESFATYQNFIAHCTERGVSVSLIGADARWILPKGYEERDEYFKFYESYQEIAKRDEKFYGMHMDIEPHQLEEWLSDNQNTVDAYVSFVLMAREVANRTGTLLELDIPCWFDGFKVKMNEMEIPLCEFCILNADTTLFMSYRDNARAAVEFTDFELHLSEKHGKKISLAYETGKIYEDVNITFDHLGSIPLNKELHELRKILSSEYKVPNVGYAVHHYNSWISLPLHGNPKGEDFPYDNPNYSHLL